MPAHAHPCNTTTIMLLSCYVKAIIRPQKQEGDMSKLQIYVKFGARDTEDHEWLKANASKEGRSMAQQMLAIIRQTRTSEAQILRELALTKAYIEKPGGKTE